MPQLVEFPLDGGGSVQVEVAPGGISPAGLHGPVTMAKQTLQAALDPVRSVATSVLEKFRDLAESPSRVEVEFGVKLSVESGVIVARGAGEANFVVRVEWCRTPEPDATAPRERPPNGSGTA